MRLRSKVLIAIAAVLIPVVAWALYWFQPWKLFTNDTIHDALPAVATESAPAPTTTVTPPSAGHDVLLSRGRFISHEHHTSGTASIVQLASGKRVLAIANLDTSEGPVVKVWLTDRKVTKNGWHVFDDGKYVNLGDLKGNLGNQVYRIPDSTDLSQLQSVVIWCDRFDVSFGAAELTPVS
jgi:hypothetical protein